jgi:hypothetical protein
MTELQGSERAFRVYTPDECGKDGYPFAWHSIDGGPGVKHLVREQAGHRCVRCHHPYVCGSTPAAWSPCDERCTHVGECRGQLWPGASTPPPPRPVTFSERWPNAGAWAEHMPVEAAWRVLTVHHLRAGYDAKRDLRWWNLAALCQRCHLSIQGKVQMERVWPWPHSEWFKPYAAGWYAWSYLGLDLTRHEAETRMDELLGLELAA